MVQYCIYLRKSRKDTELEHYGEGETLARHKTTLTEFAKRHGYNVTHIYEEIKSGDSIALRPQMQEMLLAVEENQWDGVLVMELERLARGDTRDQATVLETFKYTNTLIITPNKTYNPADVMDEEFFEFGLFMSRREYNTIKRRLSAGRLASAKEGNYIGSLSPFGYDKIRLQAQKGYTLALNDESKSVEMIFNLFVHDKLSIAQIADRLDALGIKPKKNELWSIHSLRDLIANPIYVGKIRWNWRKEVKTISEGKTVITRPKQADCLLVEGKHPAIVSDETFEIAQRRLKEKSPAVNRDKQMINPFAGLLVCGKCGKKMQMRKYPDECRIVCDNRHCDNSTVIYKNLENSMLNLLKDKLDDFAVNGKPKTSGHMNSHDCTIEALRKKLNNLNQQLSKLYDLLERGIYDELLFIERKAILDKKISDTKSELETQKSNRPSETNYSALIINITELLNIYDKADIKIKNSLLKQIFKAITITKEKAHRYKPTEAEYNVRFKF